MSNVISFPDPCGAALVGKARDKAMAIYREAAANHVEKAMSSAFSACCRISGTAGLGLDDAVYLFCQAVRAEVSKMDWIHAE
jgi:hypothetical protein